LTADGGYILGGISASSISGEKSEANHDASGDYWALKVDATGKKQWDRTVGGSEYDALVDIQVSADGGYLLGGWSWSGVSGGKRGPNLGYQDVWVVKLAASGAPEWDYTFGGTSADYLGSILPTADGSYVVGGQSSSASLITYVSSIPFVSDLWVFKFKPTVAPLTVQIEGDSVLCAGRQGQLTAVTSTSATYQWNTGATSRSITVTQAGTYSLRATAASGISSTATFHVSLAPSISAFTLGANTTLCESSLLVLHAPATTSPLAYRWSDGSRGPSLLVRTPGTYSLVVTTSCDERTFTRRIAYQSCLVLPNIVTANGDGLNDYFAPTGLGGTEWELSIYNRWGRQVYTTKSYRNEWGAAAAAGIYYYVLQQATSGKRYKGAVEVVR
jgi:hypothetical protein